MAEVSPRLKLNLNSSRHLAATTMETKAIFERKVALSPKDINRVSKNITIDDLIMMKLQDNMESKCSQHGWVIPGSLKILSRSMLQNESGRFTGAMVSWVQFEASVYYPIDGMEIVGEVLKKNKMGMFVIYKDAIQVMVPRDLHLGDEEYDGVEVNATVRVEVKKSRFQVNDPYILSVGVFKGYATSEDSGATGTATAAAAAAAAAAPLSAITEEEGAEEGSEGEGEATVTDFEEEEASPDLQFDLGETGTALEVR